MKLEDLINKKILILGFGREGKDSFEFLKKKGITKYIGIADQKKMSNLLKDKGIKYFLGKDYLSSIKYYDVIIKSPGILYNLVHPLLRKGQVLTSQTELFFDNFQGEIIGITGTKGKSTTTSLLYNILRKSGLRVYLGGNIGKPVLMSLTRARPDDIFVEELSCHQLNRLKKSPHIAIFLDIFPEHLDYYKSFKAYFRAKQNICLHQKKDDYFIFNSDFRLLRALSKRVKSHLLSFGFNPFPKRITYLKGQWIYNRGKKIIKVKNIPLLGEHNLLNVMAAITAAKVLHSQDQIIRETVKNFRPLQHRLQFVGNFRGILFYDDSLSTIPQATIAAIKALGSKNISGLILGGYDRGIDFSEMSKMIAHLHLKTIILFPPSGERIYKSIMKEWSASRKNKPLFFFVNNMKEAIQICYQYVPRGKICLLSPASPSFGVFKDYRDRGEQFIKYIKKVENQARPK